MTMYLEATEAAEDLLGVTEVEEDLIEEGLLESCVMVDAEMGLDWRSGGSRKSEMLEVASNRSVSMSSVIVKSRGAKDSSSLVETTLVNSKVSLD